MRFAGYIAIAVAILAGTAQTGRSDDQTTPPSNAQASSRMATAKKTTSSGAKTAVKASATRGPSLTPPEEIQGSWVSDATPAPQPSSRRGYMRPLPINAAAYWQGATPPQQGGAEEIPFIGNGGPQGGPPAQSYGGGPSYEGYQDGGEYGGQGGEYGGDPGCGPGGCGDDGYGGGGGGIAGYGGGYGAMGECFGLWNQVHSGQKFFVRTEYMSVWCKGNPLPPLVTTSPIGTAQSIAGVLGQPSTTILFGDQKVDESQRNGGRVTLGYWFGEGQFNGIEGHYFGLQQAGTSYDNSAVFSTPTAGAIILARPFLNVDPSLTAPRQDASILAYPNFNLLGTNVNLDGTIHVQSTANVQSAARCSSI